MIELFSFISFLLTLYIYILVAAAVMSWLVAFNVVNPRNQFVSIVGEFLYRVTEPVLRPIRNVLPNLGGIDISPVIVIIIIWFIQLVVLPVLLRMLISRARTIGRVASPGLRRRTALSFASGSRREAGATRSKTWSNWRMDAACSRCGCARPPATAKRTPRSSSSSPKRSVLLPAT